ncbi:MAG TPA: carbon storage regulator CsrA [Pantanalinema sp.]
MLVLSRKPNQSIMIGDGIEVVVLEVKGDTVKIGLKAPRDVKVYRQEVYAEITRENARAAAAVAPALDAARLLQQALKKKAESTEPPSAT